MNFIYQKILSSVVSIYDFITSNLKIFFTIIAILYIPVILYSANVLLSKPTNTRSKAEEVISVTQTRAEIAANLIKEFNIPLINPNTATFSDVPTSHPLFKEIETFYSKGITTGCAVNPLRYCPDQTVSRAEAITFLIRSLSLTVNLDPTFQNTYTDISDHPLVNYIKFAEQIGLSKPCTENKFCPNEPIMTDKLQEFVNNGKRITPARPMRWIQPNYHPDKFTVWETVFEHPELWDNTFKNVDVLGLFIYSIHANREGYLDKVAQIVKKYNLKTNVELSGLMMTTSCGDQKAEESARLTLDLIKPLYDRGIKVNYLSIDGAGVSGIAMLGCESMPLDSASNELVQYLKLIHAVYPEIKFGLLPNFPLWPYKETPNIGGVDYYGDPTRGDFDVVLENLYNKITSAGERIEFVLVDSPYNYTIADNLSIDWMYRIVRLENQVERLGLTFGLIFNTEANGENFGNEAFYTNTLNYKEKYLQKGGSPGIMMIESWYLYPKIFVPDNISYTFTNLVSSFFNFPQSAPSGNLTRAKAATEIVKWFKFSLVDNQTPTFSDVSVCSQEYQSIETIYANKITSGCSANPLQFCPDQLLKRSDAITFLLRATSIPITIQNPIPFNDVPPTHPLYNYLEFAAEKNIYKGCNPSANLFCPDEVITIGEWDVLATKILDLYHKSRTCPSINRCSTDRNGVSVSFTPNDYNGCYTFELFPVYPLVGYPKCCENTVTKYYEGCKLESEGCLLNSINFKSKSCCTIQLGLNKQTCN